MKHLFTVVIVSVTALIIYASVDWDSPDLSPTTSKGENTASPYQTNTDTPSVDEDKLWLDTVMFAKGHSFGYSGDISMWGGWYFDTIFVGDDNLLRFDSIGPSTLKLSLITHELIVDLGDQEVANKIRLFMYPIKGFKRFQKNYELCLNSATDEEYGIWKYMGEFSFTVDYPDSGMMNANKINHFIGELTDISEIEKVKVLGLSVFYAGFKQTNNYRPVYTGNANDIKSLSDFLAHKTFENWIRGGEFDMGSSASTLVLKPHIANERFITFGKYEYNRIGTGHGGYTETFHTFDLKNEIELTNRYIFQTRYLDKVAMTLFEVMAKDTKYRAWHGDTISQNDIASMIEGWQSPDPILEGTEWEESEKDVKFELPDGALTHNGVVFSFQPYEIDCWASGAYHFIVPYNKLLPCMTQKAKRLINK